ncbi:hypothetical protein ONS95_007036 [Cadophora gregata]|uniref:uncharacterized protein n=1 Tax=Cadophora gregata TaxID=51156 RepID=UPI0026DAF40C|nr:uncharacterized protein ONS95_007036 [Cadophora gregata]KAK0100578.1 hypothetical protein ONS95_007036 [Cadophora gregata]KAK0117423.1 hypothetical protein ONS96_013253 [Cadophora gregata f. sp. sojae]
MNPPTDFQLFPRLPPELRLRIWRFAIGTDPDTRGRTIRIIFYQHVDHDPARLVLRSPNGIAGQPQWGLEAQYRFLYSLSGAPSDAPFHGQFVNREVRREFFPNFLHLHFPDRRPTAPIRFNAVVDTIFMDLHSLRALYDFARPEIPDLRHIPTRASDFSNADRRPRLIGFNRIQILATPMEGPEVFGLVFLRRRIFTGLTQPVGTITTFPDTDVARWIPHVRATKVEDPLLINDPAELVAVCRVAHAERQFLRKVRKAQEAERDFIPLIGPMIRDTTAELIRRHTFDGWVFFQVTPPPPPPPPPPPAAGTDDSAARRP